MTAGAPAAASMNGTIAAGTSVPVTTAATGATNCAFVNGGAPGGSVFTTFTNGACVVPQNLAGITYLHLTNAAPADNTLTDAITVAGPMVMQIS